MEQITYIALLRAINVGGHVVKMEKLRELFRELGFKNVRTYIQSGNVFFDIDEKDVSTLIKKIEQHLHTSLGYEVPTMLRTIEELEQVIERSPFKGKDRTDDTRFNIIFFNDPLPQELSLPLASPKNDCEIVAVTDKEAYVLWRLVNGRPGNFDSWLGKSLGGIKGTNRFYHTAIKMLEAAKEK